ncbi:hypothetical protein A5663_02445 [Mycobacterium sp. E740]|nr:hypothetical protein A5663_02445 [Mycobacterium sp. E740]
MKLLMGQVSVFDLGQPRQLDAIGRIGRQVLGLDRELQHCADELVGLSHPRGAESLAFETDRPADRQVGDPHLKVIEPDIAQRHVLPSWHHHRVEQRSIPCDRLGRTGGLGSNPPFGDRPERHHR